MDWLSAIHRERTQYRMASRSRDFRSSGTAESFGLSAVGLAPATEGLPAMVWSGSNGASPDDPAASASCVFMIFGFRPVARRTKHQRRSRRRPDSNGSGWSIAPAEEQLALIADHGSHGIPLAGISGANAPCIPADCHRRKAARFSRPAFPPAHRLRCGRR